MFAFRWWYAPIIGGLATLGILGLVVQYAIIDALKPGLSEINWGLIFPVVIIVPLGVTMIVSGVLQYRAYNRESIATKKEGQN